MADPPDQAPDQAIDLSVPDQPAGWGAYQETPAPAPPRQGALDYARDAAIDIGSGLVNIPRSIMGATEALPSTTPEGRQRRTDAENLGSDIDWWMQRGKSERGRYVAQHPEENKGGIVDDIVQGALGLIPMAPVAATGVAAPAVFGAMGYGEQQTKMREAVRFVPDKDLITNSDQYRSMRAGGMDESAAREALLKNQNTWETGLVSFLSNAVGGGLLSHLGGKTIAKAAGEAVTDRIVGKTLGQRLAGGALEGGAGFGAMAAGSEYAEQAGRRDMGLQPTVDEAAVATAGLHGAEVGAVLGGVGHAAFGPRRSVEPGKRPAPPVGTTVDAVATEQLAGQDTKGDPESQYGPRSAPADAGPAAPPVSGEPEAASWQQTARPGETFAQWSTRNNPPEPAPSPVQAPGESVPSFADYSAGQHRDRLAEFGPATDQTSPPGRRFPRKGTIEDITPAASLERVQALRNELVARQRELDLEALHREEVVPRDQPRPDDDKLDALIQKHQDVIDDAIEDHEDLNREQDKLAGLHKEYSTQYDALVQSRRAASGLPTRAMKEAKGKQKLKDIAAQKKADREATRLENSMTREYGPTSVVGTSAVEGGQGRKGSFRDLGLTAEGKASTLPARSTMARILGRNLPTIQPSGPVRLQNVGVKRGEREIAPATRLPLRANVDIHIRADKEVRAEMKAEGKHRDLTKGYREELLRRRDERAAELRQGVAERLTEGRVPHAAVEEGAAEPGELHMRRATPENRRGTHEEQVATEAALRREKSAEPKGEAEWLQKEAAKDLDDIDTLLRAGRKMALVRGAEDPHFMAEQRMAERKSKERSRKNNRTKPEYELREELAKQAATSEWAGRVHEHMDALHEMMERLFGAKGTSTRPQLPAKGGPTIISKVSRETVMNMVQQVKKSLDARLDLADAKFAEAEARLRTGGQTPQVSWKVGKQSRFDTGPWFSRLTELKQFRDRLGRVLKAGEGGARPSQQAPTHTLANELLSYYMGERLTMQGRLHEVQAMRLEERALLRDQFNEEFKELQGVKGAEEEADAMGHVIRDIDAQIEQEVSNRAIAGDGAENLPKTAAEMIEGLPDRLKSMLTHTAYGRVLDAMMFRSAWETQKAAEINRQRKVNAIDEYGPRDRTRPAAARGLANRGRVGTAADVGLTSEGKIPAESKMRTPTRLTPYLKMNPFERDMVKRFGEGWLHMSPEEKRITQEYGPATASYEVPQEVREHTEVRLQRASDLNDAINSIPDREIDAGDLREVSNRIREAFREDLDPNPTMESVAKDIDRANAEMDKIERELRNDYEEHVPGAGSQEYGVGQVLDRTADLSAPGTMPVGSFRIKLSSLLRKGDKLYGILPDINDPRSQIHQHFYDVASRVLGDMDVVALTPEQMTLAADKVGLHPDTPAFYDPKSDRVFIGRDALNGPHRAAIVGHELWHALTERAAQHSKDVLRRLDRARAALRRRYFEDPEIRTLLADNVQALDDVHEFVAHLWQPDGNVAAALHAISTTHLDRLNYQSEHKAGLLSDVLNTIKRGLTGLFFNVSKKRLLNDATINSLDLLRRVDEKGRQPFVAESDQRAHAFGGNWKDYVPDSVKDALYKLERQGGASMYFLKYNNLRNIAERMAGDAMRGIVHKIADIRFSTQRRQGEIIRGTDAAVLRALGERSRVDSPEQHQKMLDYINNENYAGVFGDEPLYTGKNAFVDKADLAHLQRREAHAGLAEQWKGLTEAQRKTVHTVRDYYGDRYTSMRKALLGQMLHAYDMVKGDDPRTTEALVKYIGREKLADEETDRLVKNVPGFAGHTDPTDLTKENLSFREQVKRIRSIPEFRRLQSPYYAMMRRGDWVAKAKFKLDSLAKGGERIADSDEWSFDTPKQAEDFIKSLKANDIDAHVLGVREQGYQLIDGKWVRPEGVPTSDVKNQVLAGDTDVKMKTHVEVNPLYFELLKTEREAQERLDDLRARHGELIEPASVLAHRDRQENYNNPQYLSSQMREAVTSMKNSRAYRDLDPVSQQQLDREWIAQAERFILGNSARSRFQQRRYALGADKSVVHNLLSYSNSTSHALAEIEHRPQLRDAVTEMDRYVKDNEYKKDDRFATKRSQVQNEIYRRLRTEPSPFTNTAFGKAVSGIMKLSYLDKLGSPGFVILNATEPWLITAPMLAGDHGGLFKAYGELRKAYQTLGFGKVWGAGIEDAKKVWRSGLGGDPQLTDNFKMLTERLRDSKAGDTEDLIKMTKFLHDTGYLDRDAGMELQRIYNPEAKLVGRVIDMADGLTRAINAQVENVNRMATAIAAYRLHRAAGNDHDAATRYAQVKVEQGAGQYSADNAPPIFNHPLGKFAFQFKKYALRITENYARMMVGTFHHLRGTEGRNGELTDLHRQYAKQLSYMLASQMLVSGALGLPTEGLKGLINAANVLGLSPYNSDDAEAYIRQGAEQAMGTDLGEIATRGLPRYLGWGIGTRVGHDSLWTYGTLGSRPDDWWTAVGHLVGGAPGAYVADLVEGTQLFAKGTRESMAGGTTKGGEDMLRGAEKLFPLKVMADSLAAARQLAYPVSQRSGQPMGPETGPGTATMNVIGFRTGAQQEASDARAAFKRFSTRYTAERTAALQMYAAASTPAERRAVREGILQHFNDGRPDDEKISIGDMMKAEQAYMKKQKLSPDLLGTSPNKHTRGFLPSSDVYRFGQ